MKIKRSKRRNVQQNKLCKTAIGAPSETNSNKKLSFIIFFTENINLIEIMNNCGHYRRKCVLPRGKKKNQTEIDNILLVIAGRAITPCMNVFLRCEFREHDCRGRWRAVATRG